METLINLKYQYNSNPGNTCYLVTVVGNAYFCIRSVDTHHETSNELSRSSGHATLISQSILPVSHEVLAGRHETVAIGPVHKKRDILCGFLHHIHRYAPRDICWAIQIIRNRHAHIVVHPTRAQRGSRLKGMKPSKSVPYIRNGVYHTGFCIRSVDTHHETSTELSRSSVVDDISLRYTIHALLRSSSSRCEQYYSQLSYLAILDTFKY